MLKIAALKLAEITGNRTYRGGRRRAIAQSQSRWREWVLAIAILSGFPSVVSATHEADHRFTVEGYVCGADGKSSANVDVLVKDTKISYGQIVKTDGDGH